MIDKLKEIIAHFESLELKMADPNFVNDQKLYTESAREHRRLSPIVEKSNQFISVSNQLNDDVLSLFLYIDFCHSRYLDSPFRIQENCGVR